jgi:pimeloyl-ACP methyl ester carboxylesterase
MRQARRSSLRLISATHPLRRALALAATAAAATAALVVAPSAALADPPSCQAVAVPVVAGLTPATMRGTLCIPAGAEGETVMVLIPGGTYDSAYWDFPYRPEVYSFTRAMNARGYATLVVDQLGTGASSRPLSATLTAGVQAAAVHRVIERTRNGQLVPGVAPFDTVILGGHSIGSGVAIIEAATFGDADAVLLTGFAHALGPGIVTGLATSVYPALLDPQFSGGGYDPGYLTTTPGSRQRLFYSPSTTDPAVVAADEASKDVLATTVAPDVIGVSVASPYSHLIDVPVLLADGDHDGLFCVALLGNCASASALLAAEAPYYAPAACLQTYLLPGAGHDVNLATNAPAYQEAAADWADAVTGAGPEPGPDGC